MVVIVEDDPDTLSALCSLMEHLNLEYRGALTLEDGLTLLKDVKPTILLTDLCLGPNTPESLLKYSNRFLPGCKSILVTAAHPIKAERLAQRVHVDHILIKPFMLDDLEKLLVQ